MSSAVEAASPERLAQTIEEYLADHPAAALLEEGRVLFDMRSAHYAVTEQHGRCLLQLWSEERNLIRTVTGVEERAQCLRLATRRMGAARPQTLELVPTSDRRTPTARDAARRNYQRLLERALTRHFTGSKVDGLRSAMDLEHSFGPAYVRGRLLRGSAAEAVIGVSEAESAAMIDGVLTLGILWLDHCRRHGDVRRHFGGLKVIVPAGAWRTTAERMAWLNHAAAHFQLFTLDERGEELTPVDFRDIGNLDARLVHAFSAAAAIERCQEGVARLLALVLAVTAFAPLAARAQSLKTVLGSFRIAKGRAPQKVLWLIGPEGDFTPAEMSLAKTSGFEPITLGPLVLRCETAAVFAISVLSYELQNS